MNLLFAVTALFATLLGLAIGSFLNVVIHRVPGGQSVVAPKSRCPHCGAAIKPHDNIPLLSFALLRGRCRQCGARISYVYPLVELLTAAVFVAIAAKTGPTWESLLSLIFASALLALIFIDARHQLLPNVITYPLFVFALAAAALRAGWGDASPYTFDISIVFSPEQTAFSPRRAAWIGGLILALAAPGFRLMDWLDGILFNKYFEWEELDAENNADEIAREQAKERHIQRVTIITIIAGLLLALAWAGMMLRASAQTQTYETAYSGLLRACVGAMIGGGVIWWMRTVYFFLRRMEGMGLGDVKMMAGVGAFLGWQGAFSVLLLGSILGAVVGVIMAVRSRNGLKTALPFGVCLGIAALVVMLAKP